MLVVTSGEVTESVGLVEKKKTNSNQIFNKISVGILASAGNRFELLENSHLGETDFLLRSSAWRVSMGERNIFFVRASALLYKQ